jgi:hypothetical protein
VVRTLTELRIEGFWIAAYKGIVQGQTWNEFLRNAEESERTQFSIFCRWRNQWGDHVRPGVHDLQRASAYRVRCTQLPETGLW